MCRLLGIVASEPTEFRIVLKEAPRSMATLSRQHPDGWGLAIYDDVPGAEWVLHKSTQCAGDDERFHTLAVGSRGEILVAHIRQRTVGHATLENTHPFQRGRWVFAHNGTIKDLAFLRAQCSPQRLAEIAGQTDSELFFAYLLTCLDRAGLGDTDASLATDAVLRTAMRELRARPDFGACNFLLSEGRSSYAHRFGRSLFLLERSPNDRVVSMRETKEGVMVQTPWSQRRQAVIIASERLTDEPWQEVPEGTLLRVARRPMASWRLVDASAA